MSFYIQIENGQPIGHPYPEENILDVHGQIPSNFQPFIHKDKPDIAFGRYQRHQKTYGLSSDGVTWTEIFTAVDMTPEEKTIEINYWNGTLDALIQRHIDHANDMISKTENPVESASWNAYIAAMNAIVKEPDPMDTVMPMMPKKINGVFVPNTDTHNVWNTKPWPWY